MYLSLIAACTPSGVIGKNGGLPWPRLKGDLPHFKSITKGKYCIAGRVTAEPLKEILKEDRKLVIITRDEIMRGSDKATNDPDAVYVSSVGEAIGYSFLNSTKEEIMVIGGGQIYTYMLPMVERIYLTVTHEEYEGDVKVKPFADIVKQIKAGVDSDWQVMLEEEAEAGTHTYYILKRR
jgi:dihydrofolate reductase